MKEEGIIEELEKRPDWDKNKGLNPFSGCGCDFKKCCKKYKKSKRCKKCPDK
jgi:hypothetical protein